ncbi:MAG TPA: TIM44-like domain-containing protein [Nitrospira sp.]|nr:TIM44-like domain-containing protein [Nitrospira sp.]
MHNIKVISTVVVLCLMGTPTISLAKARGGSRGGYSSGSRSSDASGGIGSRGLRTYDNNGARPIQQSTTPNPSATPSQSGPGNPTPAVQPAPAQQPSFLERHPILTGIGAGLAGSWIGHMLFGASESAARPGDTTGTGQTDPEAGPSSTMGPVLLLMLLGAGVLYYVMRVRRTPGPDFSGLTPNSTAGPLLATPSTGMGLTTMLDPAVSPADQAAFQQILLDVQTAWGKQDLAALRRLVTPEMLSYFSTALSENTSQEVENRVEDIRVVSAEVREAWTEDTTRYATALLRWQARDYTVSLTKYPGESGYLVEGSDERLTDCTEVWTFLKCQNGKWVLSAIQQVDAPLTLP